MFWKMKSYPFNNRSSNLSIVETIHNQWDTIFHRTTLLNHFARSRSSTMSVEYLTKALSYNSIQTITWPRHQYFHPSPWLSFLIYVTTWHVKHVGYLTKQIFLPTLTTITFSIFPWIFSWSFQTQNHQQCPSFYLSFCCYDYWSSWLYSYI